MLRDKGDRMTLLRFASLAVGSLSALTLATALLGASSAHAQQPPPLGAPTEVSGSATIVVTPPAPAGYAPVQVIEAQQVYGTPYQQQGPNLRVGQLQAELLNVEAQYSQYSLGGSIALIAIGGPMTGIAGLTFMIFNTNLPSGLGSDGDGVQRGLIISGVLTLVGIAMLVGGIVMMVGRISERRPYGRRIKEIKQELANYGVRASLDVVPLPAGGMVTGSLTF